MMRVIMILIYNWNFEVAIKIITSQDFEFVFDLKNRLLQETGQKKFFVDTEKKIIKT